MSWFDNLSPGATTALAGVAGDIISQGYKVYQIRSQASRQADEYNKTAQRNAQLYFEDSETALRAASEQRKKTERELQIEYDKIDKAIGSQKQGFANAGVVVSAGSAAQVQADTAEQGRINADIIFHNGMTEVDRMKDLARRYKQSGYNTLNEAASAGYLLESAAATKVGNIFGETVAKTGKTVYDIGTSQGWWGSPSTKTTYAGAGTYGVKPGSANWH